MNSASARTPAIPHIDCPSTSLADARGDGLVLNVHELTRALGHGHIGRPSRATLDRQPRPIPATLQPSGGTTFSNVPAEAASGAWVTDDAHDQGGSMSVEPVSSQPVPGLRDRDRGPYGASIRSGRPVGSRVCMPGCETAMLRVRKSGRPMRDEGVKTAGHCHARACLGQHPIRYHRSG